VFKIAHNILINKIYNDDKSKLPSDMCIDSTDILNKLAYQSVDYTYKYKNKKGSRISTITECKYDIILAVHLASPTRSDSTLTSEVIKSLPFKLRNGKRKPKYLIADAGYINEQMKRKLIKQVHLIYPYRKNQKMKNSEDEKIKLKKRYKIENANSWMKNCKRLTMRVDRLDETFLSMLYMRTLMITSKKIIIHKIII
jgi:hypothetical protein